MLLLMLLVLVVVAAFGAIALWRFQAAAAGHWRHDAARHALESFAPALAAVHQDPKQLLVWYPLAQTSRKLSPEAFAALDGASGGRFPFTKEHLEAAHARWSADWLAWERAHDAEFSVKAAEVQDQIGPSPGQGSPLLRTRLAAVEQQKLEQYQQRYEEYIRTAKALRAFADGFERTS
jgi:hypothetical protein